jgi:hypothetical protein
MSKPVEVELSQLKTALNYLAGLLEEGSLVGQYDEATREEIGTVLRLLLDKVEGLPQGIPEHLVQATAVRAIVGAAETVSAKEEQSLERHMREAEMAASLGGHTLSEWERVSEFDMEYQATCQDCGGFVYVSHASIYNLLLEGCTRAQQQE